LFIQTGPCNGKIKKIVPRDCFSSKQNGTVPAEPGVVINTGSFSNVSTARAIEEHFQEIN